MLQRFFAKILPPPATPQAADSKVIILLVEDDPTQQETLHRTIRQSGVVIETASTQREAIATIQKGNIDILILDWRLSGGNSQLIFDNWLDYAMGSPCGVVSAYITPELRTSLLREGAHNVLDKPVDLEAFLRILHRYVYQVRRDRDIQSLHREIYIARQEIYSLKRFAFFLLVMVLGVLISTNYAELIDILKVLL